MLVGLWHQRVGECCEDGARGEGQRYESVSCVARDSGPAPRTTAKISSSAHTVQVPRMKAWERPRSRIEALPSASGKLATKMAQFIDEYNTVR